MKRKVWLADPEEHDFPAAFDYLTLLYTEDVARGIVERLKGVKTIKKKAKDILRASQLSLLPETNFHVKENIRKVGEGEKDVSRTPGKRSEACDCRRVSQGMRHILFVRRPRSTL